MLPQVIAHSEVYLCAMLMLQLRQIISSIACYSYFMAITYGYFDNLKTCLPLFAVYITSDLFKDVCRNKKSTNSASV